MSAGNWDDERQQPRRSLRRDDDMRFSSGGRGSRPSRDDWGGERRPSSSRPRRDDIGDPRSGPVRPRPDARTPPPLGDPPSRPRRPDAGDPPSRPRRPDAGDPPSRPRRPDIGDPRTAPAGRGSRPDWGDERRSSNGARNSGSDWGGERRSSSSRPRRDDWEEPHARRGAPDDVPRSSRPRSRDDWGAPQSSRPSGSRRGDWEDEMDAPRPRRRSSWDDDEGFGRRMLNTLTGRLAIRERPSRSGSPSGSRSGSSASRKASNKNTPAIILTCVFVAWLAGAGIAYYLNRPIHSAGNANPTAVPSVITTGTPPSGTTTPAATGTPGK